jgi:hypothetical protein
LSAFFRGAIPDTFACAWLRKRFESFTFQCNIVTFYIPFSTVWQLALSLSLEFALSSSEFVSDFAIMAEWFQMSSKLPEPFLWRIKLIRMIGFPSHLRSHFTSLKPTHPLLSSQFIPASTVSLMEDSPPQSSSVLKCPQFFQSPQIENKAISRSQNWEMSLPSFSLQLEIQTSSAESNLQISPWKLDKIVD